MLCYNLTDIEISSGVTHIGDGAFLLCYNLVSLTISSSVIDIGTYVTGEDYKLVEIINHSSLDIVAGAESFDGIAYYAKEVHTGDSKIDRQGDYLFYTYENTHYLLGYAGKDTELILPESYKGESYEIYAYAFFSFDLKSTSFSKITSVVISNGVTAIGDYAFFNCTSLTSVVIGDSVTYIGEYAFDSCDSLASVVIGDSVTSIGNYAFYACYKLVEVINRSSLEISAGSSNYGDVAYYAIEVHTKESKIDRVNDYLFYTYENVHYLFRYVGNDTELTLPNSYKGESYEIYKYAFYNRDDLTSVAIPDSVTSIGDYVFYCCTSLTSVVIPNSVTSIGDYAFYHCRSLKSVVIGDSVETLGAYAFASCDQLSEITLGESLVSIGDWAFYLCESLTSVVIGDSMTSIGYAAFRGCSSLTSIEYRGTEAQWNAISKGSDWNHNTGSYTITYNYTGE